MQHASAPQDDMVVVTSSGKQHIGHELDGVFCSRNGERFPSSHIATVIKREHSIFAETDRVNNAAR